ncbi:ATP-dependent helicase HrpB [Verrucomicrobium sp. GAS474]|uniref:ATP-dependent helicase HrpB n=1 Tax=Verrucomicrobium sp. GAS474 TaxID=1882831 RepID=UPI00087AA145|nr:ATP-dependent helicase HrpB [Verrucomicrobium sp. GAS474]SDU06920.1 ATP-dependent helicase HrpB [Verrucomicrobium sp. GAS474]
MALPIHDIAGEIASALRESNRLILQAPTGSGKSTQVPQIVLDAGLAGTGEVVVLQPRRLPARMLAARVASERNGKLGDEVGYQIRFDRVCSDRTRIRFVTEGLLLRQMLGDPRLDGVSVLVFDEFHERHLYTDLTLARALDMQKRLRPDLKIIVMSATLEAGSLETYLAPCRSLSSAGRTFPVTHEYLDKPVDTDRYAVWQLAADELTRLLPKHPEGDVLIFMPGGYEIDRTIGALRAALRESEWIVLPLHGELPPAAQDAAVNRYDGKRKVVVSTNVAETSLTIDGVRIVIDSGLARIARFDPHRGINTLLVEKIARSSADQRAGRAGRTAPGHCLRLWTEKEHGQRAVAELPEIRRIDLSEAALSLKAGGIGSLRDFAWFEAPDPRALERAESLLHDLGAFDAAGELTSVGRKMAHFPMHPRYARMLLEAGEIGCVRPIALIAALTQGRPILLRDVDKKADTLRDDLLGTEGESDFFLQMRAWRYAEKSGFSMDKCRSLGIHAQAARQVSPILDHFLKAAKGQKLPIEETPAASEAIRKCLLLGFSDHLACRLDGGTLRCDIVHKRRGTLVRDSVVRDAPLFVAGEVREVDSRNTRSGKDVEVLLSQATAVEEEWLRELFPEDFSTKAEVIFDESLKRVVQKTRTLFRDLVLRESGEETPDEGAAAALLAQRVLGGQMPLHGWDDAVEQWIIRLNRLREWMPDLQLPALTPDDRQAIIEQLCLGATSYREIKDRPVWPAVKEWLSHEQQRWLDQYAPERIELKTSKGERKAKITYAADPLTSPVLAARIQDLYEVRGDIRIASGRVPVTIHILAPNQRPIQVTSSLENFWKESYPKIKVELSRKYPKHEWR